MGVYGTKLNATSKSKIYVCEFLKTKFQTLSYGQEIRKGEVKDLYFPRLCEVGYTGEYKGKLKGNNVYQTWRDMIRRCYQKEHGQIKNLDYKDVSVDKRWHDYSNFQDDVSELLGYHTMINNPQIRFHLDKDVLSKKSKIYSKSTCCFIPQKLNNFFTIKRDNNKSNYEGLFERDNGNYIVSTCHNGKRKLLGTYSSQKEGFRIYSNYKIYILDSYFQKCGEFEYLDEGIRDACYIKLQSQYNDVMIRNNRESEVIDILV